MSQGAVSSFAGLPRICSVVVLICFGSGSLSSLVGLPHVDADEERLNRVVTDCNPANDSQEDWKILWEFRQTPSPTNIEAVFRMLDEKLARWNSYSNALTEEILAGIAEQSIQAGRPYLFKFLNRGLQLEDSDFVTSRAVLSLGRFGGSGVLDALEKATIQASPVVLESVALALGLLDDQGAVPVLEKLTKSPHVKVCKYALSSLANYCSKSSRITVLSFLASPSLEVRNSASYWLSVCGSAKDAIHLAALLKDENELVRMHSIRGLIRLNDKSGCGMITSLLKDENLSVRLEAEIYQEACSE